MLDEEKLIPFHPTNLTGKRVFVLAPHPDDETIGCGGSLAIHVNAGDPVKVVFLTNGAKGDTSGKAEKKSYIKIRQEEARKACRCLGITDLEFWPYEDRALAGSRGVLTKVIDLLEAYKPELVYAPSPLEFHPDHRATAVLLYEAIRTRDMKFEIAFYEVGQPLIVNCLVDITSVLNQKVLAADAYSTQLRERPYKDIFLGLNRFRSLTLSEGVTHAEGFCLWEAGNIRKTGVFSLFFQNLHRLEPAPGEAGSLVYEIGEGLYAENIADSKERFMNKKRAGNTPIVSVIIPTRNRQDMLREALKSVLSQTYQDIEVIVVNDGGVDISEVVDSLSGEGKVVQLRHEENRGVAAARNTALKAARGCYIAYLDDDDVYYPNHLKSLVTLLEEGQYKVAYTDSHEVLQSWITDRYVTIGKRIAYSCDFDRHRLLVSNYIPTMNIAHRLDILEEIGLFDEELECHEDWDLWIRISRKYDFYHIKKVTAAWTKRTDNTSKTHDRQAFLTTLRQIHSRYSHLVTDPKIFEAQKQVEAVLAVEVDATKTAAIIADYERQHRYGFARDFVKGKRVLDLACGEGYGSFLISEDASSVVGMESDGAKIKQAGSRYAKENLEFIQGSLTEIPMEGDKIFDVIICFEKIGQIKKPAVLLREVKRLLKPDGLLIVSTPNREFCNRGSKSKNPACASGLYIDEFKAVLTDNFKNTFLWGQKVYPSSNIFPLSRSSAPTRVIVIEKGENGYVSSSQEKKEAISIFAVASDHPIAEYVTGDSYLVDVSETLACHWRTYIAKFEAIIIDKDRHIADIEHQIQQKELQISEIKKEAADIKHQIQQKELQISEIKKEAKDKDDHLRNLERLVRVKDQYLRNLEKSVKIKDSCIRDKELHIAELQQKDAALNDIYNSRGWRALMVYSRIKERVLPQGSWRRALVRSVVNFLRLHVGERNKNRR